MVFPYFLKFLAVAQKIHKTYVSYCIYVVNKKKLIVLWLTLCGKLNPNILIP